MTSKTETKGRETTQSDIDQNAVDSFSVNVILPENYLLGKKVPYN